jgi:hypothetical protein
MEPSAVFIKTARGSEEIASRSYGLSSRARAMLIMVDGRRSAATLLAQSPVPAEADSHLAALLEGGFIAAVAQPAAVEPPPATATPATSAVNLVTAKQYINSVLHGILGPDADLFSVKVDTANDAPALLALSEKLCDVIRNVGGKKKADDFREKISSMLA